MHPDNYADDGDATPSTPTIKLAIALPHYGLRTNTYQMDMWMSMGFALASASNRFELVHRNVVDICGIEHARNKAMADAWQSGADWLLTVDADTWHDDAFELIQAISDADKVGAAVMAVATPLRRRGDDDFEELMIYTRGGPERKGDDTLTPIGRDILRVRLENFGEKLWHVDAAATSMMAINLGWLKAKQLAPPWFRFDWTYGTLDFSGEDKSFCRRVREAGGTIVTPTNFVAKHMGRGKVL